MRIIGYARTSTTDQEAGLSAQLRDLRAVGATMIFQEMVSSVAERKQLTAALDCLDAGDTFVVTKLDRLARSIADLVSIVARLEQKKVALKILAMNLDTSTPTGRLLLHMVGAVAEFERSLMLERQAEGVAKAKAAGKYRGRKPTARKRHAEARQMVADGIAISEVSRTLKIARASVYRALENAGSAP